MLLQVVEIAGGVAATGVLDSRAAWMTVGLLVMVAAISGKPGSLLGKQLPFFSTVLRQILGAMLGVFALTYGYLLEDFRVTKLAVQTLPASHDQACPLKLDVVGTVRVAGGAGSVTYRFVYPHRPSPWRTLEFERSGGKSVSHRLIMDYATAGTQRISGPLRLEVAAPDSGASEATPFDVSCRRPATRGFKAYRTDGYRALYPQGWLVAEDDVVRTTYYRSKFVNPTRDYFILIDWTPGLGRLGPIPRTLGSGYELIDVSRIRLGSRRVLRWRFKDSGEYRVNFMFTAGGDGYAVLAGGYDARTITQVARRVAASVSAR